MIVKTRKLPKILLLILIALIVAGCAALGGKKWPEIKGRVVQEAQDEPIADAIIVALWKGEQKNGNQRQTVCYHVETAATDHKGKFSISDWREPKKYSSLVDRSVHLTAYKREFRTSELTTTIYTGKRYTYYLADTQYDNSADARKQRLKYLQLLIGKTSCDLQGNSKSNLQQLYSAIVKEAGGIAITADDEAVVEKLKTWESFVQKKEDYP